MYVFLFFFQLYALNGGNLRKAVVTRPTKCALLCFLSARLRSTINHLRHTLLSGIGAVLLLYILSIINQQKGFQTTCFFLVLSTSTTSSERKTEIILRADILQAASIAIPQLCLFIASVHIMAGLRTHYYTSATVFSPALWLLGQALFEQVHVKIEPTLNHYFQVRT